MPSSTLDDITKKLRLSGLKDGLRRIPKFYTIAKWACLIIIAASTAGVGFFQSLVVAWLYRRRSLYMFGVVEGDDNWLLKFLKYASFNGLLAFLCCFSLYVISPAASGSGIPDVKAYLNGVEHPSFANFFRIRTFIGKVIGSTLAVSSGLKMGKEGPMLHAGSILAVILGTSSKSMQQQMEVAAHWGVFTYNKEIRDLVAIGAACGVTAAFKAPVGGVLFAMEMSTRWNKELTWRAFMATAITVVTVKLLKELYEHLYHDEFLKWGSLISFQMSLPTPYHQVWAMIILAGISGFLGSLFTQFNTWVCLVRKKWAKFMWAKITEVVAISVATSIVFFILPVTGTCKPCTTSVCYKQEVPFDKFPGYRCKEPDHYNDMSALVFNPQGFLIQALFQSDHGVFSMASLLMYGVAYWLMAAITYGAFIPSGLFTPSLIFGGCIGRMFAEVLVLIGAVGDAHVGMYALLGAAGFLGGLMRMSAAQALILMEMTASPAQLPFLMLTLVLSKEVGDHFCYSVFDHQMLLKGLAFVGIDEKKAYERGMNASNWMSTNTPSSTLFAYESVARLEELLDSQRDAAAFPVTDKPPPGKPHGNFRGLVSRKKVQALLEQRTATLKQQDAEAEAAKAEGTTPLHKRQAAALARRKHAAGAEDGVASAEVAVVVAGEDAEPWVNPDDPIHVAPHAEIAPIIIPPNMPLPFVYRLFNAEGFNYLPVIQHHGPLLGVVSRKELVHAQDTLDKFHMKEMMAIQEAQIQQGHLIQSMNLTDNTVMQPLKRLVNNPQATFQDWMATDSGKPLEEQREYYVSEAYDAGNGSPHANDTLSSDVRAPLLQHDAQQQQHHHSSSSTANGWSSHTPYTPHTPPAASTWDARAGLLATPAAPPSPSHPPHIESGPSLEPQVPALPGAGHPWPLPSGGVAPQGASHEGGTAEVHGAGQGAGGPPAAGGGGGAPGAMPFAGSHSYLFR